MPPTLMNFPINPTFGYTGEEATEQRMARSLEGRLMTRGTLAAAVGPGAYQPKLDPVHVCPPPFEATVAAQPSAALRLLRTVG